MLTSLEFENYSQNKNHLHSLANVVSLFRRRLTHEMPNWGHISLQISENGIETYPLTKTKDLVLALNCQSMEAEVKNTAGTLLYSEEFISLSPAGLARFFTDSLGQLGYKLTIDKQSEETVTISKEVIQALHSNLRHSFLLLHRLKSGLSNTTSDVQLWAHGFDLAFNWYSGKGEGEEREMIYHGFSPGDNEHPDPYYAIYVYPWSEGFVPKLLPLAELHTKNWKGLLLDHNRLVKVEEKPEETLHNFFATYYQQLRETLVREEL